MAWNGRQFGSEERADIWSGIDLRPDVRPSTGTSEIQ